MTDFCYWVLVLVGFVLIAGIFALHFRVQEMGKQVEKAEKLHDTARDWYFKEDRQYQLAKAFLVELNQNASKAIELMSAPKLDPAIPPPIKKKRKLKRKRKRWGA